MAPAIEDEPELTRKQRREQARTQRREMEQAAAAQTARRMRLIQLGGVGALVIVVVVVILVASGGSKKAPKVGSKEANTTVAEVNSLIGGIHQEANTLGSPTAPVTLRYFGDLECPICRDFTLGALKPLIQNDVRTGKLRIEYHSLETATREPEVFKTQQAAALAAGKQDKAWYFIELFYHEQGEEDSGYVTEAYLQNLAQQVPGLNLAEWTAARSNPEYTNQVAADAQAANNAGFSGTPSFLIGRTGGTFQKLEYTSVTEPGSFESAVEKLVKS